MGWGVAIKSGGEGGLEVIGRRETDEVRLLLAREDGPAVERRPGKRERGGLSCRKAALFTTTALPKWTRKKLQRARSKILL